MPRNNLHIIKPLLTFRSDDDYYFLQIIQRKKDHNGNVNGTNNNNRLIRPYYVGSVNYLEFIMDEVIALCNHFNARAGIDLNRRSYKRSAFHCLKKISDQIMNEDYINVHRAYSKIAGQHSYETDKKWILDYDGGELPYGEYKDLKQALAEIDPVGQKVIETIPSKSGLHIITSPFNLQQAKQILDHLSIEVHKRNPTNLYIP